MFTVQFGIAIRCAGRAWFDALRTAARPSPQTHSYRAIADERVHGSAESLAYAATGIRFPMAGSTSRNPHDAVFFFLEESNEVRKSAIAIVLLC